MTERRDDIENRRVSRMIPLVSPCDLKKKFPLTDGLVDVVAAARDMIEQVVSGHDGRFVVIVGPCSIHSEIVALEYARKLAPLAQELSDRLVIVMRTYFEKPRTVVGWKGLINDPRLDETCEINDGLELARKIAHGIVSMGLPIGMEALDPTNMHYLSDLLAWAAIGARTVESPLHREMASGLSMPVGFKNSCDGSIVSAANAVSSARFPHSFQGINNNGHGMIVRTTGNPFGHVILRGGSDRPNYGPEFIGETFSLLGKRDLPQVVIVDCSHGNSSKDHTKQRAVLLDIVRQRIAGASGIVGAMLESNLKSGKQEIPKDLSCLEYGVSITDACIGWEETADLLREVHELFQIS